jgi:hypothetical protein
LACFSTLNPDDFIRQFLLYYIAISSQL